MKRVILFLVFVLGSAVLVLAQSKGATSRNPATPGRVPMPEEIFSKRPNPEDLAAAPRVSVADLKKLLESNKAIVVDVRSLDSYKAGHIPGSRSIPLIDIPTRGKELAGTKVIVTYCA